jgi:hypothetical protein
MEFLFDKIANIENHWFVCCFEYVPCVCKVRMHLDCFLTTKRRFFLKIRSVTFSLVDVISPQNGWSDSCCDATLCLQPRSLCPKCLRTEKTKQKTICVFYQANLIPCPQTHDKCYWLHFFFKSGLTDRTDTE